MARSRTPETRAQIRRWSRWEAVSGYLLLVSALCAFALPLIGIGIAF